MQRIEAAIERIEKSLLRLEGASDATRRSCSNMDDHIGFVEDVYSKLRRPLTYLLLSWRSRSGATREELPALAQSRSPSRLSAASLPLLSSSLPHRSRGSRYACTARETHMLTTSDAPPHAPAPCDA
jgi:hypothetical protein